MITTNSTFLPSCQAFILGSIKAILESTLDQTWKPSQDSLNWPPKYQLLSTLQDKQNRNLKRFLRMESIARKANFSFIGKAMTKSKPLGYPLTPLKEPVPLSKPTGLTPITKQFPSTSLGLRTNVSQLGPSRNPITFRYHLNLTLRDFGHLSKTLTTPKPKPPLPFLPLMNLIWKPNRNHIPLFYFFSVRGNVMESTIIATIHCPDIWYCLFGIPLVTHIPYHIFVSFLLL